jgi:dTDP-4-dehydrorhamnose reductase
MKILLFGRNGQIGSELARSLSLMGDLVLLSREGDGGLVGDLTDLDGIRSTIGVVKPDVIVNAAAYTAVDKAESEQELAYLVNVEAPADMAKQACQCNALFVNYSTDYVFDGSGSKPWYEDDRAVPLNIYGKTKLEGEKAVIKSGCRCLVFRTSWVYSHLGRNFIQNILNIASERKNIQVVDDQIGSPTGADLIADITTHAIRETRKNENLTGIYHLVASDSVSWCEYARYVISRAIDGDMKLVASPESVKSVSSDYFKTAATRPQNSRMNTDKIRKAFNLIIPSWKDGVSRAVDSIVRCCGNS